MEFFYLIILNWFTKLFLYGIEIVYLNIKYIYMVNFVWYRYCIFKSMFLSYNIAKLNYIRKLIII